MVRAHLGLIVPKDRERLWIRVDDQILHWDEGKVILFDDSYEHEVRNDTDELRAVLFIDIDRPMDKVGTAVNKLLFSLIKASPYVKQPLKNLANWHRRDKSVKWRLCHNPTPDGSALDSAEDGMSEYAALLLPKG